jgi:hypothetical protein
MAEEKFLQWYEDYGCGNCDSPVTDPVAHVACGHGYMTGCDACGIPYEGGYIIASEPDSGPPCQEYITELETGIRAGNTAYREEYEACRARWSFVRTFTPPPFPS